MTHHVLVYSDDPQTPQDRVAAYLAETSGDLRRLLHALGAEHLEEHLDTLDVAAGLPYPEPRYLAHLLSELLHGLLDVPENALQAAVAGPDVDARYRWHLARQSDLIAACIQRS